MMKLAATGLACVSIASVALLGAHAAGRERSEAAHSGELTLNALDYRLNIYDFRQAGLGTSRQIDQNYREYLGDLFFGGEDFTVIENDRYTGNFVLLGEEKKPDNEFNLYHSLRIYKRTFQVRQFPFLDRYLPYPAIESSSFFGNVREQRTVAKVGVGQLYLLRLFHRTTVGDERIFLLKILDFTPGVKVTAVWRELESSREP